MNLTSNAQIVGVIVGILGVLMPIWLRLLDYLIHLCRRCRQVVNIRKLVAHGVSQILNSDKENLPFRSATPGSVGRPLDDTKERRDAARLGYLENIGLNLQLALEYFSNDLSHIQKSDVRLYLAFQQEFLEKWKKTRREMPPMDVYTTVFIPRLKKIKWFNLDTERLMQS